MIDLPPAIRDYLTGMVARRWPDGRAAIGALPDALPEGEVLKQRGFM